MSAARQLTIRTAVSADARQMAEEALGGSYIVLPNGVDLDRFAKADPVPTTRPAVLFLGRHEPRKGLAVLLDAWAGLDREAVLWVASDGPETQALRERRTPNVVWLGRITDDEKAARLEGGDDLLRARARSGVVRDRAARGDGGRDRGARLGHPRLPQRRPPAPGAPVPPGTRPAAVACSMPMVSAVS